MIKKKKNIVEEFYNEVKKANLHVYANLYYLHETFDIWLYFLNNNMEDLEEIENIFLLEAKHLCGDKTEVIFDRANKTIKVFGENKINKEFR